MPDLGSTISLNASKFAAGVAETRAKLTELNTALIENRNKMKEVSKEAQELQKQEKALTDAMKDGGTEEQRRELEQLRVRIGQVNAELGTLRTREQELQGDIRKTSNELKTQKDDTNQLAGATDTATAAIKKLETGLKAILAGAAGKKLYEVLIGSNAEMEQYLTSFEVMLGDAQKAKDLMSELNTMAAKTPMELTDVVSSGTLLMNYGVDPEDLIDTMTKLGDLASGNAAKFERVSLAYGQMLAKGKVSGEELRQMTEAGVPLLQALADELGVTSGEMQDLVSKGQIGIPELNAAITSMTTGTGQFAGMMEKQSQTFSGMLSTLSDEAQQFGREVGEGAFGVAKESISELLDTIDKWRDDGTLDEIAKGIGTTVEVLVRSIKLAITLLVQFRGAILPVVAALGSYKAAIKIQDAVDSFKKSLTSLASVFKTEKAATEGATAAQNGLNTAMAANPIGLIVGAVAALTVGLVELSNAINDCNGRTAKLNEEAEKLSDTAEEYSSKAKSLEKIRDKYAEIDKSEKGAEEKGQELKSLQDELISQYGEQANGIDLVNGKYTEQSDLLDDIIKKNKDLAEINTKAALDKAKAAENEGTSVSNDFWKSFTDWNETDIANQAQQWAFRNLKTVNGWGSALGTSNQVKKIQFNGSYEERYNDLQALYDYLTKDLGQDATNSLVSSIVEQMNEVSKSAQELKKLEDAVNGVAEAEEAAADGADKASGSTTEAGLNYEKTRERIDELKKSSSDLVSEYGKLYDSLDKLKSGESLNYEQMQDLIAIYPNLAKYVRTTADGYSVEIDAIDDLNDAVADSARERIEKEREVTKELIEEQKKQMEAYARNMDFSKAQEAKDNIAFLNSLLSTYDTLPDYLSSGKGKKVSSGGSSKKEEPPKPPGLKLLMSYAKTTSAAFKEMNDNGELALTTVQALIDAGYESALEYDEEKDRWTINAEAYENAANEQITAAQGVEGATKNEIAALESLRKKLSEVEAGAYGVSEATKHLSSSEADSDMSMLSEAFSEQKSNKTLSFKTADRLKGTKYAKALEFTEGGAIKLKPELVTDDLQKEIDSSIEELKKQKKTAKAEDIFGIEAEIKLLEKLKKEIKDVTSGTYGENSLISDATMKDLEAEQKKRLKAIDDELKAKQKLRDETLKAIDDEVKARQKLTEDNDIQKQIDQVMAQLRYSQLDEFSRAQLGRKLQSLENEKADMLWKRDIESRKESANSEYDSAEERLNDEKERINNALDVLKELNNTFDTGMKDLGDKIKAAIEELDPGSTMHLTFNNTSNLSESQIVKLVADHFGIDAIQ